jgi:methionyl-tRNA formyltransferase
VGLWRHANALAAIAGPTGLVNLLALNLSARVSRVTGVMPFATKVGGVRAAAKLFNVSYKRGSGPGDPRLLKWLGGLEPDLVVSLQSHRVPPEALSIPRLGWLNLHHGRLPEFRGVFSVFWAMRRGETTLYATAHLMSMRFDEGPVIAERAVAVRPGASVAQMEATMWAVSPDVMLEAVQRLEANPTAAISAHVPTTSGYYTYPTRRDVLAARSLGLRMR